MPVCTVLVTLQGPDESPIVGAQVTARLTRPVVYDGLIVPATVNATTDNAGACSLQLWPNAIDPASATSYSFEIRKARDSRTLYFHGVVVPDVPEITLAALLGWVVSGALEFEGSPLLIDGFPVFFS